MAGQPYPLPGLTLAGAKAVLKRYREEHPEAALPDDLRDKLADTPPP
ncbi:hypothetical protein ABWL39_01005 [Chitinivorax sp. PXF-14]